MNRRKTNNAIAKLKLEKGTLENYRFIKIPRIPQKKTGLTSTVNIKIKNAKVKRTLCDQHNILPRKDVLILVFYLMIYLYFRDGTDLELGEDRMEQALQYDASPG